MHHFYFFTGMKLIHVSCKPPPSTKVGSETKLKLRLRLGLRLNTGTVTRPGTKVGAGIGIDIETDTESGIRLKLRWCSHLRDTGMGFIPEQHTKFIPLLHRSSHSE